MTVGTFVDEVYVSKEWRRTGVAEGMLQRAVGSACAELMVRREGRTGEEAAGEPWKAYERMGLSAGAVGEGGRAWGGRPGCQYMCGQLRMGRHEDRGGDG